MKKIISKLSIISFSVLLILAFSTIARADWWLYRVQSLDIQYEVPGDLLYNKEDNEIFFYGDKYWINCMEFHQDMDYRKIIMALEFYVSNYNREEQAVKKINGLNTILEIGTGRIGDDRVRTLMLWVDLNGAHYLMIFTSLENDWKDSISTFSRIINSLQPIIITY